MILSLKTAASAIGAALNLTNVAGKHMDDIDPTLLASRGSMTRLLGDYIIEPTFVVSQTVASSPGYEDVLELNMNMFSTLYINTLLKLVNIHKVKHSVAFKIMSSNTRGEMIKALESWKENVANESDTMSTEDIIELSDMMFANEDDDSSPVKKKPGQHRAKALDRSGKEAKEPVKLNKNINVTISVDGKDVLIPIIIRPIIHVVSTQSVISYVSYDTDRSTFTASWHRMRSGIDSFADFILAKKLISEDRDKLMNEESNIIDELKDRQAGARANNPATVKGFAGSYGTLIISSNDKNAVNTAIRGKLDREADKNKLLDRIGSFNLLVMDDSWESVSIYTSYIKAVSVLKYDKIKSKSESSSLDSLLKSMADNSKIRL